MRKLRLVEDWEVEIGEVEINKAEYEKRIYALVRALLEIDDQVKSGDALAEPTQEAA